MNQHQLNHGAEGTVSCVPPAEVRHDARTGQQYLTALHSYAPGDVICSFHAAMTFRDPTQMTIQIADQVHIIMDPEFLLYTNHSCDPNVFFDTSLMQVVCLRPVAPGDELTFFYPGTEWSMAEPFHCHCGSPGCLKVISGASQLPAETLAKYRLTDFIRMKVLEKESRECS